MEELIRDSEDDMLIYLDVALRPKMRHYVIKDEDVAYSSRHGKIDSGAIKSIELLADSTINSKGGMTSITSLISSIVEENALKLYIYRYLFDKKSESFLWKPLCQFEVNRDDLSSSITWYHNDEFIRPTKGKSFNHRFEDIFKLKGILKVFYAPLDFLEENNLSSIFDMNLYRKDAFIRGFVEVLRKNNVEVASDTLTVAEAKKYVNVMDDEEVIVDLINSVIWFGLFSSGKTDEQIDSLCEGSFKFSIRNALSYPMQKGSIAFINANDKKAITGIEGDFVDELLEIDVYCEYPDVINGTKELYEITEDKEHLKSLLLAYKASCTQGQEYAEISRVVESMRFSNISKTMVEFINQGIDESLVYDKAMESL